jgi:hypothetical protein
MLSLLSMLGLFWQQAQCCLVHAATILAQGNAESCYFSAGDLHQGYPKVKNG